MPIRPKDGFGSNLPVAVHLCETGIGAKLPIPAAEMSERSWQRCPPSWRGTDPLSGL